MRIESNLRAVITEIIHDVRGESFDNEPVFRTIGNDVVAMVQSRVEQEGRKVQGVLTTKAAKRKGVYSWYYSTKREQAGRQTRFVDLNFDGSLWRSWQVIDSNRNGVTVGFTDETQGDIAGYLEEYYGDIFTLSADEKEHVVELLQDKLK